MKNGIFFVFAAAIAVSGLPAEDVTIREVPPIEYARDAGTWHFDGPRLVQDDEKAPLAKVNLAVHQEGEMIYEFNVRYESGLKDGHGGFGIHIFGDTRLNSPSWGSGKSYLLWLNYDKNPLDSAIPAGLSGQVYQSHSHSEMTLLYSVDLNEYLDLFDKDNPHENIPFRILVNGDTGEVRVYDPAEDLESVYYVFHMDKENLPLKSEWVALRTNGVRLSFAPGL
jgi:hypothetical protein